MRYQMLRINYLLISKIKINSSFSYLLFPGACLLIHWDFYFLFNQSCVNYFNNNNKTYKRRRQENYFNNNNKTYKRRRQKMFGFLINYFSSLLCLSLLYSSLLALTISILKNYNSKREDHKEEEDQREDERNVIL